MKVRVKEEIEKNQEKNLNELWNEVKNNNHYNVKKIIEKYNDMNCIIDLNKKDEIGNSLLHLAINNNNDKIVEILLQHIEYHNFNLLKMILNDKNKEGTYSILNATSRNNIQIVKLLIKYANRNNIILDINSQNKGRNYPLKWAIYYNNIEMIKLIVDYADLKNISLEINQKNQKKGYSFITTLIGLTLSRDNNNDSIKNIEIINLLIDYANKKNILLDIDKKDKNGGYILEYAIKFNDIELLKLFMNYAENKNIVLYLNENKIEKLIPKLSFYIIEFLKKYNEKRKINIKFKKNSELLKIFKKILIIND